MESVFLIRRIPIKGQKGEIILLEDQFEELILSGENLSIERRRESAVYRNLRNQLTYRLGTQARFETYQTRDGARVPVVMVTPEGALGIIVIQESTPGISEKRSAASFLSYYPASKIIFVTPEIIDAKVINDKCILTSLYTLL